MRMMSKKGPPTVYVSEPADVTEGPCILLVPSPSDPRPGTWCHSSPPPPTSSPDKNRLLHHD